MDNLIQLARLRRNTPAPVARRLIREQAHLTQDELAGELGVTRAAISRWESGRREPSDAYLTLLERIRREVLA